jgi:RNA polymerase sigma-70 factor (ECF subfamily)
MDSIALDLGESVGVDRLLAELRPRLHRYCARMTGSVIDGEDVVQEAALKALAAWPAAGEIARPEAWLFRIAHNAALDFLRRRARRAEAPIGQEAQMIPDPASRPDPRIATLGLRRFMGLPPAPRSCVILMDVLGCPLQEICEATGMTLPAVKAALHRGRTRLRELADKPDEPPPTILDEADRRRLAAYVERFNARDFEALRDLLADEVRLELVGRMEARGRREVGSYFGNYEKVRGWRFTPALVDGRPAALAREGDSEPAYFVLLAWARDAVVAIRDFRYARYAMDGAEIVVLD